MEPYNYDDVRIIGIIRQSKVLTKQLEKLEIQKFDTIIFSGNHKNVYKTLNWMEENN